MIRVWGRGRWVGEEPRGRRVGSECQGFVIRVFLLGFRGLGVGFTNAAASGVWGLECRVEGVGFGVEG